MSENSINITCLCGASLSFNDDLFWCEECEVSFPKYVSTEKGENDLRTVLNETIKKSVVILERHLEELLGEVTYYFRIYTFVNKETGWTLSDLLESRKVWKDEDPNIISDTLQTYLDAYNIDYRFMDEY